MDAIKIFDNVYLFNNYVEFINLSFNQFLLTGEKSMLVHTGSIDTTKAMLPKIKDILGDKQLEYVFVSHFESDECGGLSLLLNDYPQIKVICSQVTARQLMGFGITKEITVKNPGDTFDTGDYNLKFISYPSEMHLWEGLMAFETKMGLLFSSDIFIQRGKLEQTIVSSNLDDEVQKISPEQVPSENARKVLAASILNLPVKYLMPGHGPCKKIDSIN